jgi:hypothetical protein
MKPTFMGAKDTGARGDLRRGGRTLADERHVEVLGAL